MITLPEDIQSKIFEFKDGDDKYWRNKFKNGVLNELECFPKEVPWCEFLWGGYANRHGCCDLCDSWVTAGYVYNDKDHKYWGYAWDDLSHFTQQYIVKRHISNKRIYFRLKVIRY